MSKSDSMLIQADFRRILFSEAKLLPDSAVVVGVSGGVDSMVLLHLLSKSSLRVHVLHVNYHKRGESSNADEELVKRTCSHLGVQCEVMHWDPASDRNGNFQDIARQFRRDQFHRLMHETGSEAILLGHNLDDVYETLIMRVLRGAAPSNWNAMPAVEYPFIRPLVATSRAEIEGYAHENGVVWRDDESNQTSIYARNFLRNDLIPEMDRLYPGWKSNVDRIGEFGQIYQMSLDQLLKPFGDASRIPVEWLQTLDFPLNTAIIHRIHERKGLPVRQAMPEAVLSLIDSQAGKMVELDDLVAWHRDHEHLVIDLKHHDDVSTIRFTTADVQEDFVRFDCGSISIQSKPEIGLGFAMRSNMGSYTLRAPETGDKLRIDGGSKSVSDLLNEWGVPRRLKSRAYVLTLDGSVVAVIFSHPGYETRWRIHPSHACDGSNCFHFLIHH